jgi:hypothetical protein
MDLPLNQDLLCRRWVHSRGEDSSTEEVYRPADYPLPPSRGRSGFQFNADGTFKRIGIGSTDVSKVKEGTWEINPANPDQIHVEIEGQDKLLKIRDLTHDRLTIQKGT